MVEVNIKSNGKNIIASGSFITFGENSNIISLKGSNEKLEFEFKFYNDNSGIRMETEVVGENKLIFKLFNFENTLGTGLKHPVQVGTLSNKNLFLAFRIYTIDKEKEVHDISYTFYIEEN